MSYIIIGLILALMLAPVFWIMPSASQKRQMQLRQRAMSIGFQVKLCPLPQTYRERVRQQDEVQGVVYRLPWRASLSTKERFNHLILRHEDGADSQPIDSPFDRLMPAWLSGLPEYVMALELSNAGVAIYWREQGGIERLEPLHASVESIRDDYEKQR